MLMQQGRKHSTTMKVYEAIPPENLAAVCNAFRIDPAKLGRTEEPVNPSERKPGNRQHRPRRKPYRKKACKTGEQKGDNRQ